MIDMKSIRHIHCVGVGGIGLSAIAHIFLARGCKVTGSDLKQSETTLSLTEKGALIFDRHEPENIEGCDLLIYTAAASSDNPEILAAKQKGIPALSRAQILGMLMQEYKNSIAVSGTHGKTTTTSMISLILKHAEKDPTILIGGNLPELHGNVSVGESDFFITEACEYVDSFLNLHPKMEIILNIDSDHLDYFKDIDHIVSSFEKFAALVPNDGYVLGYAANPLVSSIIRDLNCRVVTFGFDETCDYSALNIIFNNNGMPSFDIFHESKKLCNVQLIIPGEHNIANALASFACCHILGIDAGVIKDTLENYTGTQRRFDIIGTTKDDIKVVDDYAHHPTEIKATLKAAGNIPHHDLWCIFQPHTYTRTIALFDDFAHAFKDADRIIITDIYAAREKNIHKISSAELVSKIKSLFPGKDVSYIESFESIRDHVAGGVSPGDLVMTMGAGDIYKVGDMIFETLK